MIANQAIEKDLIQSLRAKSNSPDGKEMMESLLKKFPSSPLLHFLFLKEIRQDEPVSLNREIARHDIYFSNLPWLKYLLDAPHESTGFEENVETNEFADAGHNEMISDKMSHMLESQAKALQEPVAEDEPMPISPQAYHRIDYFASQGIRLEEQAGIQNAIDLKVRKFTDWLKEMKRISPHPVDLGTREESTAQVEGFAASSLEAKDEIVTEAMAEVLLKQGKIVEAKVIYEKLSLMNPSKSTYFAAKIEKLNQE